MRYLIIFFLTSALWAGENILIPPHVKTQRQLAKTRVWPYLKELPKNIFTCTWHTLRGSSYHRILRREGPDGYKKIFKYNSIKRQPRTENQFSFDNGAVGEVCSRDFGYCRGFSTQQGRTWLRLGHFDPKNISGIDYPTDVGSDKWFNFYKEIIDKIMAEKKPAIVPGYENLYLFSKSHPRITRYLKERIALSWAEENINISSYLKIGRSIYNKFTPDEALKLHKKLHFRINELNVNPIVWVSQPAGGEKPFLGIDEGAGIHVMQAYRIDPIDDAGYFTVYFWDIYSPHNADNAISTYRISTKQARSNGRAVVKKKFGSRTKPNGDVFNPADFADMDLVPFDDMEIGRDAYNLAKFYEENPTFSRYLEKRYKDFIENPPPKFRVPYEGDYLPKIILPDGSIYEVPRKYMSFNGNMWVQPDEVNDFPKAVRDIFDKYLGDRWREGEEIHNTNFQIPKPYIYVEDGVEKTFEFKISWFNYEGGFLPDESFYTNLPAELALRFKEYTAQWPKIKKRIDLRYMFDHYLERDIYDPKSNEYEPIWTATIEFFEDGFFRIPEEYKDLVPEEAISYFKKQNAWPIKKPILLEYVDEGNRTFHIGDEKYIFPIEWYTNVKEAEIRVPKNKIDGLPKSFKEYVLKYHQSRNDYITLDPQFMRNSAISYKEKQYLFPKKWFNKIDDLDEWAPWQIEIPDEDLGKVSPLYREIIVGKGGAWPPKYRNFGNYAPTITHQDGSKFTFPLAWVTPQGYFKIPPGQEKILPQRVMQDIFSAGPNKMPFTRPVDIHELQLTPVKLENGELFLWPIEWMQAEFGSIKLPKRVEDIEAALPLEIQKKIKAMSKGKYPEDRVIETWMFNQNFDSEVDFNIPNTPDDFFFD